MKLSCSKIIIPKADNDKIISIANLDDVLEATKSEIYNSKKFRLTDRQTDRQMDMPHCIRPLLRGSNKHTHSK